jgi:hypothetical protein
MTELFSEQMLDALEHDAFAYFLDQVNPSNGLIADSTREGSPSSIAAVGFALAAYPIGVLRKLISRAEVVERTLATLRFFFTSPQGTEPNATGYKGFYYHFLDMQTGRRVWNCELSTIDTALLLAGALVVSSYLDQDVPEEREIRKLAQALYQRADWQWAQNGEATVAHGWTPEGGASHIVGEVTTKQPCFTSWGWVPLLIPCPRRAMPPMCLATLGRVFMATNCSTRVPSLFTNTLMLGSIFAAFRTTSCERRESITSRTVGGRLMSIKNMRSAIPSNSRITASAAGA